MGFEPIAGYFGYCLNRLGQVYSLKRNHLLVPMQINGPKNTQLVVRLRNDETGQLQNVGVARLVAMRFLTQPAAGQTFLRYKNGNRLDVSADNLEYCTREEIYPKRRQPRRKKITTQQRLKAFSRYLPLPEKALRKLVDGTPRIVEQAVIIERWAKKKHFGLEEQIYRDWCNGLCYSDLQRKYQLNGNRITNALHSVRQELINEIESEPLQ